MLLFIMSEKLTIEFASKEAMKHFATWLCELGEQNYWNWMEYREKEEKGDITVISFKYHEENESFAEDDPKRYGKFLEDGIIRTECGRLDKP